eukprot:3436170-Amphidinium_carterae.2
MRTCRRQCYCPRQCPPRESVPSPTCSLRRARGSPWATVQHSFSTRVWAHSRDREQLQVAPSGSEHNLPMLVLVKCNMFFLSSCLQGQRSH